MREVVILSGGMDSATVLHYVYNKVNKDIICVNFDYGSKHNDKECGNAKKLCELLDVEYHKIDIDFNKLGIKSNLLKSGGDIPHGHYEEDNMKSTVVPFRNGIFLAISTSIAESSGSQSVWLGNHSGDHAVYPDCRGEFISSMNDAMFNGTYSRVQIQSPFWDKTKNDVVKVGLKLNVPYKYTWSCYEGNDRPCLKCGTCVERTESFLLNGLTDPILSKDEWEQAVEEYNLITRVNKKLDTIIDNLGGK